MRKTIVYKGFRGLFLGAGSAMIAFAAHADCPTEATVDRYAQTAGDALSALHELVPESQQVVLENRYAAMVMLKWHLKGRDSLATDARGLNQILSCYDREACGTSGSDQINEKIVQVLNRTGSDPDNLEEILPERPSLNAVAWAYSTLECRSEVEAVAEYAQTDEIITEDGSTLEDQVTAEADTTQPAGATEQGPQIETAELETELRAPETVDVNAGSPPSMNADSETVTTIQTLNSDVLERQRNAPAADPQKIEELMSQAANLVSTGRPKGAIAPLEEACLMQAATSNRSAACETLFAVYTNSVVSTEDDNSVTSYLSLSDRLCDLGYSRGCDNLSHHFGAQNSAEGHKSAVAYAERSCQLANAEACATVSRFYLTGRASRPDPVAARAVLEKSCRLGRLLSCQEVADFHLRGVGGAPDKDKATEMVEASCPPGAQERADLCVSAADFILINKPAGAERASMVRTYIKRACDIGHAVGCAWYAEDLELGIGGDVDLIAAREARGIACEYGDQKSCNSRS